MNKPAINTLVTRINPTSHPSKPEWLYGMVTGEGQGCIVQVSWYAAAHISTITHFKVWQVALVEVEHLTVCENQY